MGYHLLFTPLTGHVDGETYYAQIVQESNGYIWDGSDVTEDPTYGDTEVSMTEINDMGVWGFTVPDDLPAGIFSVICRKRLTASPAAATDNMPSGDGVKRIQKTAIGRIIQL